jgi:transposase
LPDIVAEVMDVARPSVFAWWRVYGERRKEALRTEPTPGPKASLTAGQMSQLGRIITGSNPQQPDFRPALWRRGIVSELIQCMSGVDLSLVSVGRVLDKLGSSLQWSLHRAYEQEPEKVAEWKERTFPQIQARAKEGAVKDKFAADRAVGEKILEANPDLTVMNRAIRPTVMRKHILNRRFACGCRSLATKDL